MQRIALNNGLLLAGIVVFNSLVFYFISTNLFFTLMPYFFLLFTVTILYKSGKEKKESQAGFMSFGQAFKTFLFTAFIGLSIYSVYQYTLYNVIDPSLADVEMEHAVEQIEGGDSWLMNWMMSFVPDDQMDQIIEDAEAQDYGGFGAILGKFFLNMFFIGFIVGPIMAIIMRNEKNEFA